MIRSSFKTSVGEVIVEITTGGSQIDAFINKIGEIKYQFDQTPDSIDINKTIALYSQMSVDLNKYSLENIDVYDRLMNPPNGAEPLDVVVVVRPYDDTGIFYNEKTARFNFQLEQKNINYREKDELINLRFTPRLKTNVTVSDVVDGGTNYNYAVRQTTSSTNTTNLNCLPVKDYISRAMEKIFDNEGESNWETIIDSSQTGLDTNSYTNNVFEDYSNWSSGQQGFVICGYSELVFESPDADTETVFGNGLVTIDRTITNTNLNIPFDQIVNYNVQATGLLSQFNNGDSISFNLPDQQPLTFYVFFANSTANSIQTSYFPQYTVRPTNATFSNVAFQITRKVQPSLVPAVQTLKQLAGTEGAIFGTGFSKNFYVYRLFNNLSNVVSIDYSNVIDLSEKKDSFFLNNSLVGQIASLYYGTGNGYSGYGQLLNNKNAILPNILDYNSIIKGNANANKSLKNTDSNSISVSQ